MKTIYVKRPNKKPHEKITCEEYSMSGNFLSIVDNEGTRIYYNLNFIENIIIPKTEVTRHG